MDKSAYELADELRSDYLDSRANKTMLKAVDMLRQQADRIAELEKEKHCSESYDTVCPPNICDCRNKTPQTKPLKNVVVASATCSCGKQMEVTNLQPQTKPRLSDEEINEIINKVITTERSSWHEFARAIEERHGIK